MIEVTHWSAEAEQSVIGSSLLDSTLVADLGLAESAFFDPRHREIWGSVLALNAQKKPVDVVTVFEHMKSHGKGPDLVYLNDLVTSVPSASRIEAYAAIVKSKHSERDILRLLDEAMAFARTSAPVAQKIDRISSMVASLQTHGTKQMPKSIFEIAVARTQYYEDLQHGRVPPALRTGIGCIDKLLNGGLRPGKLVIVAARPGVGKSSISQYIASHVARSGHPTLFLSQEMPEEEIADRSVAAEGKIEYGNLSSGELSEEDWSKACTALENLRDAPFFVDDQPALTLADIRAKARAVKGIKLLVVDYLQLCSGDADNRNSEIEKISRGLKALSKELDCCIIALSQLSRKVEERNSKVPQLSDLRDSGAIEQDADAVLMLWQHKEKVVGAFMAKNRMGRPGKVGLYFDGSKQTWGELDGGLTEDEPAYQPKQRGTAK